MTDAPPPQEQRPPPEARSEPEEAAPPPTEATDSTPPAEQATATAPNESTAGPPLDSGDDDAVTAQTELIDRDESQNLQWSEVSEYLPTDDSGYQITPRDCEFLGITPEALENWHDRTAPLGMSPEQYDGFRDTLREGLRADGVQPDEVDVRLQGSSANFFSGAHKELPAAEAIQDPAARAKYEQWRGDAPEHPQRRPFDSMHRLGLDTEPSDYDVQISSDAMVAKAEAVRQENFPDRELLHPKYGFVRKEIAESAFPNLYSRASEQSSTLGRPVMPAVFPGSGPPDTSGSGGPSSHFRETDWRISLR
jgi:hypothetical protein